MQEITFLYIRYEVTCAFAGAGNKFVSVAGFKLSNTLEVKFYMRKALFFDIDGTLLSDVTGKIPDSAIAALKKTI